jgi:hypothetical protein
MLFSGKDKTMKRVEKINCFLGTVEEEMNSQSTDNF